MSSIRMYKSAQEFVRSQTFSERLAEATATLVGKRIVDLKWEQYRDDEIDVVLVLDDGTEARGPILGECAADGEFV